MAGLHWTSSVINNIEYNTLIYLNLGLSFESYNIQPERSYGILRSSYYLPDSLFLAVQALAFSVVFGDPLFCVLCGCSMALTDRVFTHIVNNLVPGTCITIMGIPIGTKNLVLMAASIGTSIKIIQVVSPLIGL